MTTTNEQRKYVTMSVLDGALIDDELAYQTVLDMFGEEWTSRVLREGYVPTESPKPKLSDPVKTVYDNYDGHGWLWRLFHRRKVFISRQYTLRFEGYCVPR